MRTLRTRAMRPRTRAGFTLLEVVLALGLLLLGITSVLGLLTFGAAMTRTASLRTAAASTVEAVIADLEESFFPLDENGLALEPVPIVDRPLFVDGPQRGGGASQVMYSATPTVNPNDALEYRVDIELSWKSSGVKRSKTFSTLLVREVPFGERLRRQFVDPETRGSFEAVVPGFR